MTICQTITVRDSVDIITARMHVREVARRLGMKLTEQSLISLATSSLANALGLGLDNNIIGQITIEDLHNDTGKGLKVVCVRNNWSEYSPPLSYFGNERWMVDEFEMRTPSAGQLEITMTKWARM